MPPWAAMIRCALNTMFVPPAMHHPLDSRHGGFHGVVQLGPGGGEGADQVLVGGAVPDALSGGCPGLGGRRAGELVARTEGRALRVEEDDPHVPVVLCDVELVPQLVAQRRGDRVVLLGAAQREAAHCAIVGGPNRSPHRAECRDGLSSHTCKSMREVRGAPVRLEP